MLEHYPADKPFEIIDPEQIVLYIDRNESWNLIFFAFSYFFICCSGHSRVPSTLQSILTPSPPQRESSLLQIHSHAPLTTFPQLYRPNPLKMVHQPQYSTQ